MAKYIEVHYYKKDYPMVRLGSKRKDYLHCGYVYLLHEKSQAMDTLEIYLNKVKRKLDRKVKFIRSNIGGEYYGRYDETRTTSRFTHTDPPVDPLA
ncbi:hypothetical protein CR513_17302, partial [Mucuna pruriens]